MRTLALLVAVLPGLALAQASASVDVRLNLPVLLPALVVVSPGIQVVPDVDHEVFLVDGFYWTRHGDGWVRSRSHRGGWVLVPARHVPPGLVRIPPGHYRRWHPDRDARHARYDRHDGDRGHDGRHEREHERDGHKVKVKEKHKGKHKH